MQVGLSPVLTFSDSPRIVAPGLQWWWRADAVHLVVSKADVITDLSENGHDLLQATDAQRFVWSATSGPNGTPGLTGTGGQWEATAAGVNLSAVTQLTVIVVMIPNGLDSTGTDTVISNRVAGTNQGFGVESFLNTTDAFESQSLTPPISAPLSEAISTNPAAVNSPVIVECTMDQTIAASQTNVRINGTLGAQTRPFDGNSTGGFQNLVVSFGRNFNIPAQGIKGTWAECFAYAGLLTAQERQNLYRGYLSPRYAIAVP